MVYRLLLFLILGSSLAGPAVSQEEGDEPDEQVETQEPEAETEDIDETGLDDQGFSGEDDDFRPSEDIPADQSIPFPTDI